MAALAVAAGWLLWSRFGVRARGDRASILLPEDVELLGVGEWVQVDLRGEALRDASLDRGLPLDDPELARRLARAFDIHPWVREVVRVSLRHPAGATVEVRCREPVAMVGVPGGLLAVDAEGVVLPSDGFTAEAAARYPKVSGITSGPRGAAGFPWGDPLVEEAAALAAVIGPEWRSLGLVECRPAAGVEPRAWELVGDGDLVIRFGSAPGHEQPGEPTAAMKVARLRSLAPGDRPTGPIDLTAPAAAAADATEPAAVIPAPR
ncbi:MAG: hypothetical protein ACKOCX_13355 [Planctomycetota bacterium]